jgi:superfamily I DNA/RNA helicase
MYRISYTRVGINVVGKTRQLKVPFRCTYEITAAAYSLIESDPVLSQSAEYNPPDLLSYQLPHGSPPLLISFDAPEGEVQYIRRLVELLRKNAISPREIALMYPANRLDDWAELKVRDGIRLFGSSDFVRGLEFNYVMIPQLNLHIAQTQVEMDEAYLREVRRRLFVMMSRARQQLILSYHGTMPPLLEALRDYVHSMSPR